jgi:hypothetical protein
MTIRFIVACFLISLVPGGLAAGIFSRREHAKRAASIAQFRQGRGWPGFQFPNDPWGLVMNSYADELAGAAASFGSGGATGGGGLGNVAGAPSGAPSDVNTLA